ncbi:metal ABC transporter substrate-binding protein [Halalkalibacter urbisdiaboli]|uniref:metal ABC transporter substrate-binding protein n=1 Tax=Halalkalibacter urbisdiaboli TaxID=1960589 RepID=UPI000B45425D|nr:metal ABC transporter substrate-binding protein [Halalkalibacter urbisdiaboli]
MGKKLALFLTGLLTVVLLAACGVEEAAPTSESKEVKVVTSFSILADLIENVAGERAEVQYVVPIGEEPHEYEPVPSDFQKVSDATVFYVNGFDLEGWLQKLVDNVGEVEVVEVSSGITTIPIEGEDAADPHAWLDVKRVMVYVENIRDDLSKRDPEGKEIYEANAEAYLEALRELDNWIEEEASKIPEERKTLVISENAYKYFGESYGFETIGIWELNSHEEGTPGQISRVVELIQEKKLPAVFVETTVDQRYMETVAENAGVTIAGEVYTDAVGLDGSGAETYIKMMEHNVHTFIGGLKIN